MKYLSADEILLIHSIIVDETGGSHGVRNLNAVLSVAQSPRQSFGGSELYPTSFEKAAVYAREIIMNHPFIDGNKRTGMTTAVIFLEDNGNTFVAKEGELVEFALRIVKEKLEIGSIAAWFKKHSKKKVM